MRRALKISAWSAGGLALFLALLTGGIYVAGNTDTGRHLIERLTARLTSGNVNVTGLGGSFPQQLYVERLELRDEQGVWLTADKVRLQWSPLAYLGGRLQIDDLQVATIHVQRLPLASSKTTGNEPASIPQIDAGRVAIDVLELGPQLAGESTALVVKGSAHLRTLQDMTIDAAAQRLNGKGEYALQLRFDSRRMDAKLNLHEPAGGPLENLLQVPGLGALAATGEVHGSRAAGRVDLSVDAGDIRARAQGTLDVTNLSADLDVGFESNAQRPRAGLAWNRAVLKGRWHGSFKAPVAEGHLEAAQLSLPGGIEMASVSADLAAGSGKATLQALIQGLRIPGPLPQLLEDSPVKLDASMRLDDAARPLDVAASHRLFSLSARADTADLGSGKQSAAVDLHWLDLTPLAAIINQDIHGTAVVKAQLKGDRGAAHLSMQADASIAVGNAFWSQAVGNRATLQMTSLVTDKVFRLEHAKFAGSAVAVSAEGELSRAPAGTGRTDPESVRLRWDADVSDLHTLASALAGSARASGTVNGSTRALSAEAHVASSASVRGSPSGTLSADIKIRGLPDAPNGSVMADGSFDGAPLSIDIELPTVQRGTLVAQIRRAEWKSAHLNGDLRVLTATAQTKGQLRLEMGQLGDVNHVLGSDIAGAVNASVSLQPVQGRTHADYRFEARNLSWGGLVGSVQVAGAGARDSLGFKLDVQLPMLHGAPASGSANGSVNLDAGQIHIAEAAAHYRGQDARLLAAANVSYSSGVAVDELKLGAHNAVFDLQGQISPVLDAHATLRHAEPALLNVLSPGLLESGTIEADAKVQGTVAAPTGQIDVTAKDVRLADEAALGLPPLEVQASARLNGNTADVDARLVAGESSKLNALGRVPLAADGALELKINGSLNVAMINPILEARGQHATGQLSVDATVTGSVPAPQIGGTVAVTRGSWRDYARGLSVTDIEADIIGRQGRLQIKKFTAAAAPGTLSMTGSVGVLEKNIPVALNLTATNAQPIASKLVTANLNADLRITGTARERLDIAGRVDLNRTLVGIPNGLPPNVAVLDVRRRGKEVPAPSGKELVIGMDVTVHASQEILVQGRGLDAEVGGELHLGGTLNSPVVNGGFDLVRGSFSLGSTKLNFTPPGSVTFEGNGLKNKIDPTLDFTAQSTVQNVTATLRISGPADAPRFEFSSSPPKQPDEIMALLLFGNENPASLTGLQYAQVAAALATLSGVGGDGGLNPLVKIQRTLGLDRLSVGSAGTNAAGTGNMGATIEAGRYISKRVYVEAKQSSTGTSQLQADIELTKHLKLQTRLGNGTASAQGTTPENDPGSSIGLSYQFEY